MPKLLVIDDDPGLIAYIKAVMESQPHLAVTTARDGFKGMDAAIADPPDVVLLDITMPGRDGLDVLRMLKSNEQTFAAKVIMMTGVPTDEAKSTAMELGAEAFLPKPMSPKQLIAAVAEAAKPLLASF